ncbi:YbjN domain-containing protein [Roseomonas sp. AR75]|uniref:YbjN domain-containing protein n=1 Tax=Roseomonas sp. AR75 TaxID=2562311 RepID=UPI0010BF868C|nr:YbjN domain-containing protein [Roseomonas sp. AR75]
MINETMFRGRTARRRLGAALALAGALHAWGAQAQDAALLDASDPERIAQILQAQGFQAAVSRNPRGDPMIRSAAEGINFVIYFLGCRENANCQSIQYAVTFRMGKPPTLEALNEFNRSRTLGEATLNNSGQPRLTYFMTLEGGVSEANFRHAFQLWRNVLRAFVSHIGFRA